MVRGNSRVAVPPARTRPFMAPSPRPSVLPCGWWRKGIGGATAPPPPEPDSPARKAPLRARTRRGAWFLACREGPARRTGERDRSRSGKPTLVVGDDEDVLKGVQGG